MIIDSVIARADWAARVWKQAEQMRIIALATNDDEMRDEFLGFAERLSLHASAIETAVDESGSDHALVHATSRQWQYRGSGCRQSDNQNGFRA